MEQREVIQQYTIVPDYDALDKSTSAFVFVSYDPHAETRQAEVARSLAEIDPIREVHIISGDWDLLAKVRGGSVEEIGDLVVDQLREIDGIGHTQTCTVFESITREP